MSRNLFAATFFARHRLPRPARVRRARGARHPVRDDAARAAAFEGRRRGARGHGGSHRDVLALRRRRLDRGVRHHLPRSDVVSLSEDPRRVSWSWSWAVVLVAAGALRAVRVGLVAASLVQRPAAPPCTQRGRCFCAAALPGGLPLADRRGSPAVTSFTAHMVQHLLLLLIIPLTALLAIPGARGRAPGSRWPPRRPGRARDLCACRRSVGSWRSGVMWAWHAPPCCDASVLNPWVAARSSVASLLVRGHGVLVAGVRARCVDTACAASPRSGTCSAPASGCSLLGIYLTFTSNDGLPVARARRSTSSASSRALAGAGADQRGRRPAARAG